MKKILLYTTGSAFLLFGVFMSCSKSDSSTPAASSTSSTASTSSTSTTPPADMTLVIDGVSESLIPLNCFSDPGSSGYYNMSTTNTNNDHTIIAKTKGIPTYKNYTIGIGNPSDTSHIQLIIALGSGAAAIQYVAASGTATISASSTATPKIVFTNLTFSKAPNADKKISANFSCQ